MNRREARLHTKNIMIHREDKDYGPYSPAEVKDLLAKSVFTQEDFAWVEGASEWIPLKDLFSPQSPAERLAPLPASSPDSNNPSENSVGTKKYVIGAAVSAVLGAIAIWIVVEVKDTLSTLLPFVASKTTTDSPQGANAQSEIGPPGTSFVLPSGKQFQVLSIQQEEDDGRQVLCLHYVSQVDIHDRQELNPEVDQVWPLFKKQADLSGLNWAIISPTIITSTFPVESSEYENYYYKKIDGNWELDFPKH